MPNIFRQKSILLAFAELFILLMAFLPFFSSTHFEFSNQEIAGSSSVNDSCELSTPAINLKRGSYTITIDYQNSDPNTSFSFQSSSGILLATEGFQDVALLPGSSHISFSFNPSYKISGFQISFYTDSPDSFSIDNITIQENNVMKRSTFIAVFSVLVIFNLLLLLRHRIILCPSTMTIYFILICLGLFLSIPAFSPFSISGHDLQFHLVRIEELKSDILNLDLPSRIEGGWLNNAGYAAPIFYSNLFLFFPAILRICGFSISFSYNCYIILLNLCTVFLSYYCFSRILKNTKLGLMSCFMYSASYYRLTNLYIRSAVGEYTAITFFPLIALGLYQILTEDPDSPKYKYRFLLPALGFSGLIQSHILSCEIAGFFTLLLCLLQIRRIFNRKRFLLLLKTVLTTALLNAGFLIPFLDFMRGNYYFNDSTLNRSIQTRGSFINELFIPFPSSKGMAATVDGRLYSSSSMPSSIGLALTAVLLLFIYLYFRQDKKKEPHWGLCCFCVLFSTISMWMTTCYFPWDFFYQLGGISTLLVNSLQFPWRILGIVILFLTLASGPVILSLKQQVHVGLAKAVGCSMIILSILSASWFISSLKDYTTYCNFTSDTLIHTAIGKGEYLPQNTDVEQLLSFTPTFPDLVRVDKYFCKDGTAQVSCTNLSTSPQYIDIGLLHYPYYTALDDDTNITLRLSTGTNNLIRVEIPAQYSGTFHVTFREPLIWRLSELISLITFLELLWLFWKLLSPSGQPGSHYGKQQRTFR